ncbi:hypothetical protein QAD02_010413 [Eretmocerus hayati]|uniref:Uncharacterized protein n=1 Tax=Eretmocerus hayati TaxID=131215 RepID=A0ACC2NU61_9HYME|nr:hypothetical protein QAD02_010413 [Eretmocerus hayati]
MGHASRSSPVELPRGAERAMIEAVATETKREAARPHHPCEGKITFEQSQEPTKELLQLCSRAKSDECGAAIGAIMGWIMGWGTRIELRCIVQHSHRKSCSKSTRLSISASHPGLITAANAK